SESIKTKLVRIQCPPQSILMGDARSNGRVRQLGPPEPFREISSPEYVKTSTSSSRRIRSVCGLPDTRMQWRGATVRMLHASVFDSEAGTASSLKPFAVSHWRNEVGSIFELIAARL